MTSDDDGISAAARRALRDLIEQDIPLQTQHYESPRSKFGRRLCGSWGGQGVANPSAVTCAACLTRIARRAS